MLATHGAEGKSSFDKLHIGYQVQGPRLLDFLCLLWAFGPTWKSPKKLAVVDTNGLG